MNHGKPRNHEPMIKVAKLITNNENTWKADKVQNIRIVCPCSWPVPLIYRNAIEFISEKHALHASEKATQEISPKNAFHHCSSSVRVYR